MKDLWLVATGECDDYEAVAVATSREIAQRLVDIGLGKQVDGQIPVFDEDSPLPVKAVRWFAERSLHRTDGGRTWSLDFWEHEEIPEPYAGVADRLLSPRVAACWYLTAEEALAALDAACAKRVREQQANSSQSGSPR